MDPEQFDILIAALNGIQDTLWWIAFCCGILFIFKDMSS